MAIGRGAVTEIIRSASFEYVASNRVMLTYDVPLSEIVVDFYDRL